MTERNFQRMDNLLRISRISRFGHSSSSFSREIRRSKFYVIGSSQGNKVLHVQIYLPLILG